MEFFWPPVVAEKSGGPLAVTATSAGQEIRTLQYKEPGDHVFEAVLPSDAGEVAFEVDRWLTPEQSDGRELGLIVSSVNRIADRHVH